MTKKDLLTRLAEGPVVGDGSFAYTLEKRGYVKAGAWTPEVVLEHPDAVYQLHLEFCRAGADVVQAFTFFATDDNLQRRGNEAGSRHGGASPLNKKACDMAHKAATSGAVGEGRPDALVAASLSQCDSYSQGKGKQEVQEVFQKQVNVFVEEGVDFLICEFFEHIEELEWAIEVCVGTGMTVAATMCLGPQGDKDGVLPKECAVRMSNAGATLVGINCYYDPFISLEVIKIMKQGLIEADLLDKPTYLMCQPVVYLNPDSSERGFVALPETPFALEPRVCTRWDVQKFAREAMDLGVRYLGGCCGFESYHIRAISEELREERGGYLPPGSEKHGLWGSGLKMHWVPGIRKKTDRSFWENLLPASGRPMCPSMAQKPSWRAVESEEPSASIKKNGHYSELIKGKKNENYHEQILDERNAVA